MNRHIIHITLFLSAFIMVGCHNDPPIVAPQNQSGYGDMKEHLIAAHRTVAQSEETSIDEYVSRRGWTMERLDDGVRMWCYSKGGGKPVEYEDSVSVTYNVEAINGKKIYDNIIEHYVAGHRQTLIGLDQAVMRLHRGDKAIVILPSSLAYGIGGDGDRIPQSSILVLDVKVE